mmetsp:Transcript_49734/g.74139  ORF Transcript_49734/g.74139 Transcript_49734/m.74139 type:complete len:213 (+) Transcript_49734:184-822(+)
MAKPCSRNRNANFRSDSFTSRNDVGHASFHFGCTNRWNHSCGNYRSPDTMAHTGSGFERTNVNSRWSPDTIVDDWNDPTANHRSTNTVANASPSNECTNFHPIAISNYGPNTIVYNYDDFSGNYPSPNTMAHSSITNIRAVTSPDDRCAYAMAHQSSCDTATDSCGPDSCNTDKSKSNCGSSRQCQRSRSSDGYRSIEYHGYRLSKEQAVVG